MPPERFFGFPRRSSAGSFIPIWVATPGTVFLSCHVRASKTDPLVNEVELLAHIRYSDGRETTVATQHVEPKMVPIRSNMEAAPVSTKAVLTEKSSMESYRRSPPE